MARTQVTPELMAQIAQRIKAGRSFAQIAVELHCSPSTVRKVRNQLEVEPVPLQERAESERRRKIEQARALLEGQSEGDVDLGQAPRR